MDAKMAEAINASLKPGEGVQALFVKCGECIHAERDDALDYNDDWFDCFHVVEEGKAEADGHAALAVHKCFGCVLGKRK